MNHAAFFSRQMCGNHQTFGKTTTFKEEGLIGGEKSLIDRERIEFCNGGFSANGDLNLAEHILLETSKYLKGHPCSN
jgi:hypothetical protein